MELLGDLPRHRKLVSGFAFSPDGQYLAIGSADATTTISGLSPPATDAVATLSQGPAGAFNSPVTSVTLHKEQLVLITTGGRKSVIFWDVSDPRHPARLGDLSATRPYIEARACALTQDGKVLAVGGANNITALFDLRDDGEPRKIASVTVNSSRHGGWGVSSATEIWVLAFQPGRARLVGGTGRGAVIVWEAADFTAPRRAWVLLAHNRGISGLAYAPDGSMLATGGFDGSAVIWDTADPGEPRAIGGIPDQVNSVRLAFSPVAPILIVGDGQGKISALDITTPSFPALISAGAGRGRVTALSISPDGQTAAVGYADGAAELWSI